MKWISGRLTQRAFALPTILIASVVMIIVMLSSITATLSVNNAIDTQYYNKLAQEANESGSLMAQACVKKEGTARWTDLQPLGPNTDCGGAVRAECVSSPPASCYVATYNSAIRTTFSVPAASFSPEGGYVFKTTANVILLRASNGAVWKTIAQTSVTNVPQGYQLASGNDTTCTIFKSELWCWGLNDHGQVGNGTAAGTNVLTPANISISGTAANNALFGKRVYAVSTGVHASCAIAGTQAVATAGDNIIYCWGQNSLSQFGNNTTSSTNFTRPSSTNVADLPTTFAYVAVSSRDRSCALGVIRPATSGSVWCWGENNYGQAADIDTNDPKNSPQDSILGANDTSPRGRVRYSVNNNNSSTDGYTTSTTNGSTIISNATTIDFIHGDAGCLLTDNNQSYCLGKNSDGALAVGSTANINKQWRARLSGVSPDTAGPSNYRFTDISTNRGRTCAIGQAGASPIVTEEGKIYCWGANTSSRISSDFAGAAYGTILDMIPGTGGTYGSVQFSDVATANQSTCVIGKSPAAFAGKVYCWGENAYGQLGVTGGDRLSPRTTMIEVTGLSGKTAMKLIGGNFHFCALINTGSIYCWGRNANGQIGDGTTTDKFTATKILEPTNSNPLIF